VITSDLDAELARTLRELGSGEGWPADGPVLPSGTWRLPPGGDPGSYATAVAFEIARLAGGGPAPLAAAIAKALRTVPWIQAAEQTGDGYLTITVTPQALARSAAQMAAAGPACANSAILRGTTATVRPWPDLAVAPTWQRAWEDQAAVMTGRLAQAAGATTTIASEWERPVEARTADRRANSPVNAAVTYLGVDAVRYRLARTLPGTAGELAPTAPARSRQADPYYAVQHAHADAASTLRWAAELRLGRPDPSERLADLLAEPGEPDLLWLLSWLPVRVAAAARRRRPDELPRYLEDVALAWSQCRQANPALPFHGQAAPADGQATGTGGSAAGTGNPRASRSAISPDVIGARLMLADTVRVVLAAGLALTGVSALDRM
jgi:arginyl-tRNA synthetase